MILLLNIARFLMVLWIAYGLLLAPVARCARCDGVRRTQRRRH
jgi:hypothetical protein